MYRPKFCAECGEAVVRPRWRFWMSGRFCASCDGRFARGRVLTAFAVVALLIGFGFVLGRQGRPKTTPLVMERGTLSAAPAPMSLTARVPDGKGGRGDSGGLGAARPDSDYGPDGTDEERPTEPDEVVSICGARTKKGTPCQRRVRGTGRCWQHRGKGAMLPPSKLIVPN